MEARATAVPTAPVVDAEDEIVVETVEREARPRRGSARPADRARGRARGVVARPAALSREEEYRYIRGDLNRLLVTAGALLVLMMVLLVVVE
jgi:hypothetical protein